MHNKGILRCESNTDTVDLGFEKFTCSRYNVSRSDSSSSTIYSSEEIMWLAVNKVIIKDEWYSIRDGKRRIGESFELVSYHLN